MSRRRRIRGGARTSDAGAALQSGAMRQSNSRLRRVVRDHAISVAFWLAVSPLVAWQMYDAQNGAVKFRVMLLVYAARYLSVALLTPPIFDVVGRWPVTGSPLRRTLAYGLGFMPFWIGSGVIRWLILPVWLWDTRSWEPRTLDTLLQLLDSNFADQLLVYLGVVVAAHAYVYFVRGQRQEIERLQLSRTLAQSELQTLRAQLHPHFLFNTLQGVSALIDTDRGKAQDMLLTLAGLLRKVLQYGGTDL